MVSEGARGPPRRAMTTAISPVESLAGLAGLAAAARYRDTFGDVNRTRGWIGAARLLKPLIC